MVSGTCVVCGASGVVLIGISVVLLEVSDGVVKRDAGIVHSVEELVFGAGVDVCPIAKLMRAEIETLIMKMNVSVIPENIQ